MAMRRCILVADDDREMRCWMRDVLEGMGAMVHEAATGGELLAALGYAQGYDLVITDVRMPPPDGLRALSLARHIGIQTPFLVITAFGDDAMRTAVAATGGAALLDKPFDAEDLLAAVRRLVFGAAARPATGTGGAA